MPLAKTYSSAVVGLDAYPVEVEVDISMGLPGVAVVGLPDAAVQESRERVRSAVINSGFEFPARKITINLAPAEMKKEGSGYDLAIAASILQAAGQIPAIDSKQLMVGELALEGSLRPIHGILPIVLSAIDHGFTTIYVPSENHREAALLGDKISILPVKHLKQLIDHFKEEIVIQPVQPTVMALPEARYDHDFAYIKGQTQAKRVAEIAAAGGHNVLMTGPPGSGKTYLARALPSILPSMSFEESLEVTKIYSVMGLLPTDRPLVTERPFRTPHHTASSIAIVGGGTHPKPGEISLAHRGVLFFDELPEFSRSVLEALRQPIEDRLITISRSSGSSTFPAHIMFVGSQNPCPCGYKNDPEKVCVCTPNQLLRYQKKLSGPILDRIDLHVWVPRVKSQELFDEAVAESSIKIRERVENTRQRQLKRFNNLPIACNAEMANQEVKKHCVLSAEGRSILELAINQYKLSARSFYRILKVARTIADLAERASIIPEDIQEAIMYRQIETTI